MPKKKIPETVDLMIDWNIAEDVITRFATNMVVQVIENEFKVTFFELKPDIVLDKDDRLNKMIEKGSVRADCVASIIVTADRMPKFIKVLSQQLSQYEERQKRANTKEKN